MTQLKRLCDRCGKHRKLAQYQPNQMAPQWICAECMRAAAETRREAAVESGAGRPPKRPSQIEDVVWRFVLSEAQSKRLEAWLAKQGFTGGRNAALKKFARTV